MGLCVLTYFWQKPLGLILSLLFKFILMSIDRIPYHETGYFSKLICDYLDEDPALNPFYHRFPTIENFKAQLVEKGARFSMLSRKRLHAQLTQQYQKTEASEATLLHIDLLKEDRTFTITTGHQLNIFTGPLYFLYKIISVINLTKQLKASYPDYNFVPIYWMASEDHDFDEINYFKFKGQKIQWNRPSSGAVGQLSTEGLEMVKARFCEQLGTSINAKTLCDLFDKAYGQHDNLTEATRYLANALFKEYGLVIVDGDDKELKKAMISYAKKELLHQTSFYKVTAQTQRLTSLGYPEQVHPREINLFYIVPGLRARIVKDVEGYGVYGTDIRFSEQTLLQELEEHPERFSPNALLRPLYQEVILPNLCYIGGGGELAYWMQLKDYFEAVEVPFPILLLRNSALLQTEKQRKKGGVLKISKEEWFLNQNDLINKHIRKISNIAIDFTEPRGVLREQFKALHLLAQETDASFLGAVKAQEVKQLKGLDHLEKRLLKAQKKKLKAQVQEVVELQNALFPEKSLQERTTNFSEFYITYGRQLIPKLFEALDPLDMRFTVITLGG